MKIEKIASALEAAIPGFEADREVLSAYDGEDKLYWFDELLGEDFCGHIEWKEFDSWGLDVMNGLSPIRTAGIRLSVDSLYDEEGMPLVDDECDDPYEFFMPELDRQLNERNLQLLEVCTIENGSAIAEENPRLVCLIRDPGKIDELNQNLEPLGLRLC